MKEGRKLSELALELERQNDVKQDLILSAPQLQFEMPQDGSAGIRARVMEADWRNEGVQQHPQFGTEQMGIGEYGHRHVANKAGIPPSYYDRMLVEAPELLLENVNLWMGRNPKRHMVRMLDGEIRAMMSDRFRPLDNFQLAEAALPALQEMGCNVLSCEVTERRLYLKATSPKLTAEPKLNDPVQAGMVISNSEVGAGSVQIQPLIYRLVCTNGMIAPRSLGSLRRKHIGPRHGFNAFSDVSEFFTNETNQASDRAFWLKVRDTVRGVMDPRNFRALIAKMTESTGRRIETNDIQAVVEVTAKKLALGENESKGVMRHLIEGGDLTQWGLLNAVTRHSQDVTSYDRATELEAMGGQVLDLSPKDWQDISTAQAA